jgi:hypothetical protein
MLDTEDWMDARLMSSESIHRQDASGHMPLGVCHNGRVIDLVPACADYLSEKGIAALRGATAAEIGVSPELLEILVVCHLHPQSSAVDCIDCEPEEYDAEH